MSNGNITKFHAHRFEGIKYELRTIRIVLHSVEIKGCSESIQVRTGGRISNTFAPNYFRQLFNHLSGSLIPHLEKEGAMLDNM